MSRGIRRIGGKAIPFGLANVNTDTIIPAAHLKTLSRSGLGAHVFEPLRQAGGSLFDDPAYDDCPILIAGENFGCGSSREHAVWALMDRGIIAVIATSFSDIFAGNAFKNGLVTVVLDQAVIDHLLMAASTETLVIDLEAMEVSSGPESFAFKLDSFRRDCLMNGIDEIDLTLASAAAVSDHEAKSLILGFSHPSLAAGTYATQG